MVLFVLRPDSRLVFSIMPLSECRPVLCCNYYILDSIAPEREDCCQIVINIKNAAKQLTHRRRHVRLSTEVYCHLENIWRKQLRQSLQPTLRWYEHRHRRDETWAMKNGRCKRMRSFHFKRTCWHVWFSWVTYVQSHARTLARTHAHNSLFSVLLVCSNHRNPQDKPNKMAFLYSYGVCLYRPVS